MKTTSKQWRVILSVMVLLGALGGPLAAARAEEPEPPLATYDTNWTGGTAGLQISASAYPDRYIEVADDFVLPSGSTYGLVTNVNVNGQLTAESVISSIVVRFYTNSSNLPGTMVYSQTVTISSGGTTGNFQLNLPNSAALRTNQTYWISVQVRFATLGDDWFWTTRSPQNGNAAAMRRDAPQGVEVCKNEWKPRAECESGAYGPDLYFQLTYTPFTPTDFTYLPIISR